MSSIVIKGAGREGKRTNNDNAPNPKKQYSCRLSGSSEKRTFEGCRYRAF